MRAISYCLVAGLSLFGLTAAAEAVIIAGGTGLENTLTTSTPAYYNNVGIVNGSTGIYLGDGRVLTASHVGAGSITLSSGTYAPVPGSSVRLHDPVNPNVLTDLIVYNISGDPGLPSLNIPATSPATGDDITLIGNGKDRGAPVYYNVSGSGTGTTWTSTNNPNAANRSGYATLQTNTLRFGTNDVGMFDPGVDAGFGPVRSFVTVFDTGTGDAQAYSNDSGGAAFDALGNLVGVIHSIGTFTNQPANTVIFGNVTNVADLAQYRSQIVPEPAGLVGLTLTAAVGGLLRRRRAA